MSRITPVASVALDFFWSLTLSQACPRPTAVLIDEVDTGGF